MPTDRSLRLAAGLLVAVGLAGHAAANPRPGILTAAGMLNMHCIGTGNTDEDGAPSAMLELTVDGVRIGQIEGCDGDDAASPFRLALIGQDDPQVAIFNDAFFTDVLLEHRRQDAGETYVMIRLDSVDPPKVVSFPGFLRPTGIAYAGRDEAEIRLTIDWTRLPPAFATVAAARPICLARVDWAEGGQVTLRTELGVRTAGMDDFCEKQFVFSSQTLE
ncbi:MAG TPA: hypothetical protein VI168_12720 [Croceibacterium sp.]